MGVLDVEWNFVLNSALINLLIGAVLNRLNDPPANRPSADNPQDISRTDAMRDQTRHFAPVTVLPSREIKPSVMYRPAEGRIWQPIPW